MRDGWNTAVGSPFKIRRSAAEQRQRPKSTGIVMHRFGLGPDHSDPSAVCVSIFTTSVGLADSQFNKKQETSFERHQVERWLVRHWMNREARVSIRPAIGLE